MTELIERWNELASNHKYIGLIDDIPYDHESVVALAHRFKNEPHFFLLESASSGPGQVARYSFMGFDPILKLTVSDDNISYENEGSFENISTQNSNPFDFIKSIISKNDAGFLTLSDTSKIDLNDIQSAAGIVGFLSYDISVHVEPTVGSLPKKDLDLPLAHFIFTRQTLIYDHFFRRLILVHFSRSDGGKDTEKSLETAKLTLQELKVKITESNTIAPINISNKAIDFEAAKFSVSKDEFLKKVDICLEEIKNGEIFQVQIGNRLSVKTKADPFDLFRHLRMLNPSPYMFLYRFDGHYIIGASPEMMVNVDNSTIVHRPIAGTRKRSWDDERDKQICHELMNDEKERAEHIMLVDLSRNDVGRLAEPGSVHVDELMIVEKYSHVFHMVSQVSGKLLNNLDSVDAMAYSFPNGTVSGAPKIRAMQIINELEPIRREFYAGSLGMFSFNGNLKSTILIRTLHYSKGVASTQASAGIVYDSVPELEWQETRNKMAACLTAMQNTI